MSPARSPLVLRSSAAAVLPAARVLLHSLRFIRCGQMNVDDTLHYLRSRAPQLRSLQLSECVRLSAKQVALLRPPSALLLALVWFVHAPRRDGMCETSSSGHSCGRIIRVVLPIFVRTYRTADGGSCIFCLGPHSRRGWQWHGSVRTQRASLFPGRADLCWSPRRRSRPGGISLLHAELQRLSGEPTESTELGENERAVGRPGHHQQR